MSQCQEHRWPQRALAVCLLGQVVGQQLAGFASTGEGCCELQHWTAEWRPLEHGVKPCEGLEQPHIVGFFAVGVELRALLEVNDLDSLEAGLMAEPRNDWALREQAAHMGLAYHEGEEVGSEVAVDVVVVHMGKVPEALEGHLPPRLVGGRWQHHMKAQPPWEEWQEGWGARHRMAAYMKVREWRARMLPWGGG